MSASDSESSQDAGNIVSEEGELEHPAIVLPASGRILELALMVFASSQQAPGVEESEEWPPTWAQPLTPQVEYCHTSPLASSCATL